ncbi:NAD(P)-dependent oxidoreductase [Mesorhizobium sp. B2-5-4]|uniref:NAD-dependent epimerase/dehydratase family protein n=1 Tax=Mesorhizobium sp. B2-5-4 TaxID=2589926 RepID=UPI00112721A1|nr:NAD(P)-dependent oxidoreductase [Mesorhizobium sp. B2-5-4]TPK32483.1 NAD(P)-dependent oxidoreductase [Mesorhizobium sp. B2-5-4]
MLSQSILVTGANGLLGYDVVKRLVAEGRQVVAVDRAIAEVRSLTDKAFELEIGDVHKLHEIAHRHGIDAIIHCGGFSGPSLGRRNPALMFGVNVGGTLDVAELARQITIRSGRCRLLFCSSLTVYGNQPADDITEDFPLLAQQCYASSKIAGEAIVAAYAQEHDVDAISLRIAGVYGPRRKTSCVLRLMISNALAGRPTHLPYGNGFPRQWVYVDDVVEGILLALDVKDPSTRRFNISGGVNPTIDQAAAIIREAIPSAEISLEQGADPEDVTLGRLSIEAAQRELGLVPAVSLREGIRRLIQAIKEEQSL